MFTDLALHDSARCLDPTRSRSEFRRDRDQVLCSQAQISRRQNGRSESPIFWLEKRARGRCYKFKIIFAQSGHFLLKPLLVSAKNWTITLFFLDKRQFYL
jgi:hypothetical protein